jgi:hypothetical protein
MSDQELAELRRLELELGKVCNEAEKAKKTANHNWSVVYHKIIEEEQYRKVKAQVLKDIAQTEPTTAPQPQTESVSI